MTRWPATLSTKPPFWAAYKAGVGLRNTWVHSSLAEHTRVTGEDAERFIFAVVDLIEHVESILTSAGVPAASERFRVDWVDTKDRLQATVHVHSAPEDPLQITLTPVSDGAEIPSSDREPDQHRES